MTNTHVNIRAGREDLANLTIHHQDAASWSETTHHYPAHTTGTGARHKTHTHRNNVSGIVGFLTHSGKLERVDGRSGESPQTVTM